MSILAALRIFPARLMFPQMQADCRWIAINANNRKSFILRGKDEVSEILLRFSGGFGKSEEDIEDVFSHWS